MKESVLRLVAIAGVLFWITIVLVLVLVGAGAGQYAASVLTDDSDYLVWVSDPTPERTSVLWVVCTRDQTRCLAASVIETQQGGVWVAGAGVPRAFGPKSDGQTCLVVDQVAVEPERYGSVALSLLGKPACWITLKDGRIRNSGGVVMTPTSREPDPRWLPLLDVLPKVEMPRT